MAARWYLPDHAVWMMKRLYEQDSRSQARLACEERTPLTAAVESKKLYNFVTVYQYAMSCYAMQDVLHSDTIVAVILKVFVCKFF